MAYYTGWISADYWTVRTVHGIPRNDRRPLIKGGAELKAYFSATGAETKAYFGTELKSRFSEIGAELGAYFGAELDA